MRMMTKSYEIIFVKKRSELENLLHTPALEYKKVETLKLLGVAPE